MKQQFFTQYWGQYYKLKSTNQKFVVNERTFPLSNNNDECLILKDLSNITDQDAEIIMQSENFIDGFLCDDFLEYLSDLKKGICHKLEVIDYLRSKGYALPYMSYSIEDLVKLGWIEIN